MTLEIVVGLQATMTAAVVALFIVMRRTVREVQGIKGDKGDKGDRGDKGDTGPRGIAGERGGQADLPAASAKPDPDIHEVLTHREGHWVHHGWVRAGTPAWQDAYDTPGLSLKPPSSEIVEGVQ